MATAPLRADAARNLERIEAAAREVFGERGFDASMEEIARRAGVGKGTLFRRFPTKDALVYAVLLAFQREIEALVDVALEEGDPLDGVRRFLCGFVRLQSENAGFFDMVAARHETLDFPEEMAERGVRCAEAVLAPAKAAGVVREELAPGDLLACAKMLGTAARPGGGPPTCEADWSRYVELVLAGMRPGASVLPGHAYDPCARLAAHRCPAG